MCLPCLNHVAHWLETEEEGGENRPHILTSAKHLSRAVQASWAGALSSSLYLPSFYSLALKNTVVVMCFNSWQPLFFPASTQSMHCVCFRRCHALLILLFKCGDVKILIYILCILMKNTRICLHFYRYSRWIFFVLMNALCWKSTEH